MGLNLMGFGKSEAVRLYSEAAELAVPKFAIEQAVRALCPERRPSLEALALVRAAFRDTSGRWATVEEAKLVCVLIIEARG